MKIKTNDFSVQFFKYKDKNNWFSAAVIDNLYHFADGFTVNIVIVTNGLEREHRDVYFRNQWAAFCLVHSFYNKFFGG